MVRRSTHLTEDTSGVWPSKRAAVAEPSQEPPIVFIDADVVAKFDPSGDEMFD